MALRCLGDDLLFPHHKNVVLRCLEWIDCYGDRDGDDFQEYQTRSEHGYENMEWRRAELDAEIEVINAKVKGGTGACG